MWIRHTVHKRPNEEFTGAVWMTYFDVERERPLAAKRPGRRRSAQHSPRLLHPRRRIGDRPGTDAGNRQRRWLRGELESPVQGSRRGPAPLLPKWMYTARLPRTKLLSPHPNVTFDGILEVDGERIADRTVARHGRPQLGRRTRRELGLDPRRDDRRRRDPRLRRHGRRPCPPRSARDPLGSQRPDPARRRGDAGRRVRQGPADEADRRAHRLRASPRPGTASSPAGGLPPPPTDSSAGSTPIRSAQITMRSTVRSPTST